MRAARGRSPTCRRRRRRRLLVERVRAVRRARARSSTQVPAEYLSCSRSPATSSSCPLRWEPDGVGRADRRRRPPARAVRRRAISRLARGVGDITRAGARQRPADQRARAVPRAGREPGRGLLGGRRRRPARSRSSAAGSTSCSAPTRRLAWHGRVVGRPHRRRRPRAGRRRGADARSPRDATRASSTGSAAAERRHAVAPRPVHVVHGQPGPRQIRGLMRRHHRAQARRTGAARLRAQVLGGVPPRARGGPAAARARRHEEHVPGGGVARSADAADLDPRLGADAGAEPPARCRRATPWTSSTGSRRTRASSSGCSATCSTSTVSSAGSCRPSVARPTSAELVARVVAEIENPDGAADRGRDGRPDRGPSTARRSSGSSRTWSRTPCATPRRTRTSGCWATAAGRRRRASASTTTGPGIARARATNRSSSRSGRRRGRRPSTRPGVGIGLSLVRRFAELHGGRAWVEERARRRLVVPRVPAQRLTA